MPVNALSLLGFMDEQNALGYLQNACCLPGATNDELLAHWQKAKDQLGQPMPNAGIPEIKDIPQQYFKYLQDVEKNPRFAPTVEYGEGLRWKWAFKLVEIAPLLAYQVHLVLDRCNDHCGSLREHPKLNELLSVCLPYKTDTPEGMFSIDYQTPTSPNGLWGYTNLNNRILKGGYLGEDNAQCVNFAGIVVGPTSPLVQVARFNGRYYLKNGFHRAYGLSKIGVRHIPCVLVDVDDYAQIVEPGNGFPLDLMESANPPTCGHFSQGRAYALQVKKAKRVIRLTWSEAVVLED